MVGGLRSPTLLDFKLLALFLGALACGFLGCALGVATGGGEQVKNVLQEFADSLGRDTFLFGLNPKSGNEC